MRINKSKYLNLGCGIRTHIDWLNVDKHPSNKSILQVDITKPLPFGDNEFEIVYNSHVLEHLQKDQTTSFISECYRILRPGSIIRIVVPNLELLVRKYISILENVDDNPAESRYNHEWILLMLFDQMVRVRSGGEMLKYLSQDVIPNESFVKDLCGKEIEDLISAIKPEESITINRLNHFFKFSMRSLIMNARKHYLKLILGKSYNEFQLSEFRNGGEIHQWMYDRLSLGNLLSDAGFKNIQACTAFKSRIPDWGKWNLDVSPEGEVYKKESLFMEATK